MNVIKALSVIVAAAVLGGCSVFSIGEAPPECAVDGGGVDCVSTREVWAATDTYSNLEGMTAKQVKEEAQRNDPNVSAYKSQGNQATSDSTAKTQVTKQTTAPLSVEQRSAAYGRFQEERLQLPSADPLAVREAPQILRVTVAPYVNSNDSLVMPVQVFAEVEKRTWTIGEKASQNVNTRTPTAVRALSASASQASQDIPQDTGGLGVEARPTPSNYNFEGIIPPSVQTAVENTTNMLKQ